jgi:hypothetical protein
MAKQNKKKVIKGTDIPFFNVIVPMSTNNGLTYWGIGETTDISILKHLNEGCDGVNRKVAQPHKGDLGKVIRENGFAGGIAVCILDGVLWRVDGNHRAEELADNNCIIRFSFRTVSSFNELIRIMIGFNDSAKNWGLTQYIKTYESTGNESYALLTQQKTTHGLTTTITASLISNTPLSEVKRHLRLGTFKMDKREAAVQRVLYVRNFLDKFGQSDQRPAEGLLLLLSVISFSEFKSIYVKLAERAKALRKAGFMLAQKTSGAKEFYELFNEAYQTM